MKSIQIFNNEELSLKIRTIQNEDGSISLNAEDTAIGFGWYQKQNKNRKVYTSIRWETLNQYCEEFSFPNKLRKMIIFQNTKECASKLTAQEATEFADEDPDF